MKNLNMTRIVLFCVLCPAISILQGCVPPLPSTGTVSFFSETEILEHAAYTDYIFAIQAKNKSLQEAGKPLDLIIPEREWEENVFIPRFEYARYYTRQTAAKRPVNSFEVWKETDYPEQLRHSQTGSGPG